MFDPSRCGSEGECAEWEDGSSFGISFFDDLQKEFLSDRIVESLVEVIEVEGGVTVFLSECSGDGKVCKFVGKKGPLVAKSDHVFDTFLTLLLERYGGGVLRGGVQCRCTVRTGCHLLFL